MSRSMAVVVCLCRMSGRGMILSWFSRPTEVNGADVGIRTPGLRITNALLYQLSYVGGLVTEAKYITTSL